MSLLRRNQEMIAEFRATDLPPVAVIEPTVTPATPRVREAWVSGNAGQIADAVHIAGQTIGTIVAYGGLNVRRNLDGLHLRTDETAQAWLLFPIPTTTPASVTAILLRAKVGKAAAILSVTLYDGQEQVHAWRDRYGPGEHDLAFGLPLHQIGGPLTVGVLFGIANYEKEHVTREKKQNAMGLFDETVTRTVLDEQHIHIGALGARFKETA